MDALIDFVTKYDTNVILGFTCLALLALLALFNGALHTERNKRRSLEHDLTLANSQLTFAKAANAQVEPKATQSEAEVLLDDAIRANTITRNVAAGRENFAEAARLDVVNEGLRQAKLILNQING